LEKIDTEAKRTGKSPKLFSKHSTQKACGDGGKLSRPVPLVEDP